VLDTRGGDLLRHGRRRGFVRCLFGNLSHAQHLAELNVDVAQLITEACASDAGLYPAPDLGRQFDKRHYPGNKTQIDAVATTGLSDHGNAAQRPPRRIVGDTQPVGASVGSLHSCHIERSIERQPRERHPRRLTDLRCRHA
jgi:hypothetical protein